MCRRNFTNKHNVSILNYNTSKMPYSWFKRRMKERETGLLVDGIDFRGREIACLAAELGPLACLAAALVLLACLAIALGPLVWLT